MKGKAAVYYGPGKQMEIKEFSVPKVEPEAVLIKVRMANICGSDLHIWKGERKRSVLPTILGHEMTGTVFEPGNKIKKDSRGNQLAVGDRVVYPYMKPCGRCHVCLSGQGYACPERYPLVGAITPDIPPHFIGAYAQYYYLISGLAIFKVPDELSDELVSPVNCALSQSIFGLAQAGINLGDTVIIQGAGGLGINSIAVAREMGAGKVIVVDKIADRLKLAQDFGADHTVNLEEYGNTQDLVSYVTDLTDGRLADVAIEVAGVPEAVSEGVELLRCGGRYLVMGSILRDRTTEIAPGFLIGRNLRLFFVGYYEPWAITSALDLLVRCQGTYPFHQIVSHRFPLNQINEAFEFADQGKATRVSIVMDE